MTKIDKTYKHFVTTEGARQIILADKYFDYLETIYTNMSTAKLDEKLADGARKNKGKFDHYDMIFYKELVLDNNNKKQIQTCILAKETTYNCDCTNEYGDQDTTPTDYIGMYEFGEGYKYCCITCQKDIEIEVAL